MKPSRIQIIPALHGKITRDGKMSEPDIYWIIEKWLARHPQIKKRQQDIRIIRGRHTLPTGILTENVDVSLLWGKDIDGYDPAEDADLYEYFLADDEGVNHEAQTRRPPAQVENLRRGTAGT